MKILGLDLGTKRIGIAISDESETLASGRGFYERRSTDLDLNYFKELIDDEVIGLIVLGLPQNMDGSLGPKAQESLAFKSQLESITDVPIELFDERLTTHEAERVLIEANVSRKKRKGVVDQQAAVLILQGYLDARRANRS